MNANDVVANEKVIKLLEGISEKLSCLLSELKKANGELVDSEIMTDDELNVKEELELTVKPLVTQNEELVGGNCIGEHMGLCDMYSYVNCSFEL